MHASNTYNSTFLELLFLDISDSEVNISPIIRHIPIRIYWYGDCTYSILNIDVNWVRVFSQRSSKIKHVHVEIITRVRSF